ncbi:MAG: CoA-acylating methylmalonate-semialdehyde dehydrogenase [Gammaproteobacteria bacterium]|nr:CoA-acylating methylmalonate-semialdehyde dehydrogenase [Gammaproteobacteria bacterium]
MLKTIPHYIDGQFNEAKGKKITVYNPCIGSAIAQLHCADVQTIRMAIDCASQAQKKWAQIPPIKRAKIIRDFLCHIEKNQDELSEIVSLEHGKTLADAKASIQRGLEITAYHTDIQQQLQGTYSQNVSQGIHSYTLRQPLGICVGITPFNFPVMVPLWMLVPAIACGNAFILKPSEKTPSASLKLIEWFEQCGLPKGVAQCLHGDAETVQALLEQPEIQAFTVVGSTPAAQHIYSEAAKHGKRAHTFGGAKNHAIIMPDADLEHAAESIVSAAYGSAGQRCMALSAILTIDNQTSKKLLELLVPKVKSIRMGLYNQSNVDMGPVISSQQVRFLEHAIDNGVQDGAQLLIDGRTFKKPNSTGFFIGPSLFTNVKIHMPLYQKELFGPILVHLPMNSLQDAIACINQHPFGNGTVIFTQNGRIADAFIEEIQAGMVGINIPIPVPIVSHPFGGWKQSSFGSHAMHGIDSIQFYTKQKSVTQTWPKDIQECSFNMPYN